MLLLHATDNEQQRQCYEGECCFATAYFGSRQPLFSVMCYSKLASVHRSRHSNKEYMTVEDLHLFLEGEQGVSGKAHFLHNHIMHFLIIDSGNSWEIL